jgi:hypothetical protein
MSLEHQHYQEGQHCSYQPIQVTSDSYGNRSADMPDPAWV